MENLHLNRFSSKCLTRNLGELQSSPLYIVECQRVVNSMVI
jgi:hypothetical protein